jgi:hypothetical protein
VDAGAGALLGVVGLVSGPSLLTAKSAAWSAVPSGMYCSCRAKSPPSEQIGSPGTHDLSVFAEYSGPITTSGWPIMPMKRLAGVPNKVTAAT